MFSREELKEIDKDYFTVTAAHSFSVTVTSKNTLHEWHILSKEGKGWKSCDVYHRHHHEDPFHFQEHKPTLKEALHSIRQHDEYILEKNS